MILKKVNWKRLAILVKKWLQKNIFHIVLFGVITAIFILVVWEIASKQKMCNYEEEKQSVVESSVVTITSLNDNVTNSSTTIETESTTTVTTETTTTITESATTHNKYFDIPLSTDLQDYMYQMSDEYDVPVELIIALIDVESHFQSDVISRTNDYGLGQINICNHEWLKEQLGLDNLLDPYQNIKATTHIIAGHYNNNDGDINKAVMCYNAGAGGAASMWRRGIYSTAYSRKVVDTYKEYLSV